jgi:hypothetical protein
MESRWIGKWKKIDESHKIWKNNLIGDGNNPWGDGATNDLCQQIP